MKYPDQLEIKPLAGPPVASVRVPGSKSITNRALVLAALTSKGFATALRGALRSEDTEVMVEALRALGFRVLTEWPENAVFVSSGQEEPTIPARGADLYVANSGTTMRFLTALVALGQGRFRLDGVPRMRERPIGHLLDALQALGVDVQSEANNGCPPVVVQGDGIAGGDVTIRADISSQFLSGLLMAAPCARGDVTIRLDGPLVSWPYIFMTIRMMAAFRLQVEERITPAESVKEELAASALLTGNRQEWGELIQKLPQGLSFFIRGRQYRSVEDFEGQLEKRAVRDFDPRHHVWLRDYWIEPDASAASYFFA
ncbi:MAG: 3-phosphoshikimate 1-carboxyvinyltransferase, partial [Gemmataceae bacterium]